MAAGAEDLGWVIEPSDARELLAGGALLLDARAADLRATNPLTGAVAVDWRQFTEPEWPRRGTLLADDAVLSQRLQQLGVSNGRAVVVIGDPLEGWAEDARVAWTLRTLGHDRAYVVNGGAAALLAAGPTTVARVPEGDFVVARSTAYEATQQQVRAALGQEDVIFLDAREPREFAGGTPYGESRAGHLPGARPLYFRDLIAADGRVLQGTALAEKLSALGVQQGARVVAYCSGGVRAAFVTMVLRDAGIDARNYAGSMWEWSAAPAETFPLVVE
jgi:thiosulfate/3-mercaptopyruvate sulfurtransferase